MLKRETKTRARALQILYAWEQSGRPPVKTVVERVIAVNARCITQFEAAEPLAEAVAADVAALDQQITEHAEHWRIERIGVIEKSILRLALYELMHDRVPPKVAINEAVRLAHWFGGSQSAPFVNGVLDAAAHQAGRL